MCPMQSKEGENDHKRGRSCDRDFVICDGEESPPAVSEVRVRRERTTMRWIRHAPAIPQGSATVGGDAPGCGNGKSFHWILPAWFTGRRHDCALAASTWLAEFPNHRVSPMNLPRSVAFVFPFQAARGRRFRAISVLVVAAHPDDETIGASSWLLRAAGREAASPARAVHSAKATAPAVLFFTDGTPRDDAWFSHGHAWNGPLYRQVRRREARAALAELGVPPERILFGGIRDQELARHLREGMRLLRQAVRKFRPLVILVPAYEGGHPDHDAANFLVACLRSSGVVAAPRHWWEYSLYTSRNGRIESHFLPSGPGLIRCSMLHQERRLRHKAVMHYRSQAQTLRWLGRSAECFRPLMHYDYSRPPVSFQTTYEIWGMPWTAASLCQAFRSFLQSRPTATDQAAGVGGQAPMGI